MAGGNEEDDDGSGNSNGSLLFEGKQFWLSQNVPQRSRFKELIEANGGIVRLQEKDADIKLVDHTRKNLPSDTYVLPFVRWSWESKLKTQDTPLNLWKTLSEEENWQTWKLTELDLPHPDLWEQHTSQLELTRSPTQYKTTNYYGTGCKPEKVGPYLPRLALCEYCFVICLRFLATLSIHDILGNLTGIGQAPAEPGSTTRQFQVPGPAPAKSHERCENAPATTKKIDARKRKRSPDGDEPDRTEGQRTDDRPKKRPAPATLPEKSTTAARHRVHEEHPTHTEPEVATASKRTDQQRKEEPKPKDKGGATVVQVHKTQQPSEAPDSIPNNFLFELPFFPSSPESQEERPQEQDIDTWIDDRLRTGRADNEEQVIEALQCTSMDPRLADKVLEYLAAGKGIPEDMPGVWTPEDDECVEVGDSRAIERVLKKHGSEAFEARWNYLSMARAAGLSGGGMGD
ncbi:hypothetical protein LV164_006473 [Aspergillus fumigatus]|nr:hypothetical protein KXX42_008494 [Aspergillus fumigatus]KAH1982034.1 hypothetical protein KXW88_005065 [Aspergillus fumigatus]KAH2310725.1 hypothetical protein KXV47_004882 [Aspergillus fumigatus]KAH2669965.1 hypothetical protein KXV32_003703 [Aspergillus fumigatus]KAH2923055.1 hypothetical protein KXW25_007700 [Aspergillus fumigatus]